MPFATLAAISNDDKNQAFLLCGLNLVPSALAWKDPTRSCLHPIFQGLRKPVLKTFCQIKSREKKVIMG